MKTIRHLYHSLCFQALPTITMSRAPFILLHQTICHKANRNLAQDLGETSYLYLITGQAFIVFKLKNMNLFLRTKIFQIYLMNDTQCFLIQVGYEYFSQLLSALLSDKCLFPHTPNISNYTYQQIHKNHLFYIIPSVPFPTRNFSM